jgi:hypothetical protein
MTVYVIVSFVSLLVLISVSDEIGKLKCLLNLGNEASKRIDQDEDPKDLADAKHGIAMKMTTLKWIRILLVWGHVLGMYFIKN